MPLIFNSHLESSDSIYILYFTDSKMHMFPHCNTSEIRMHLEIDNNII